LVIWLVKIVPEMTYNVLSGTLSLYTTTTSTTITHFYSSNYNDDDVNTINTLTVFLASEGY